jgi:hypothetical protein
MAAVIFEELAWIEFEKKCNSPPQFFGGFREAQSASALGIPEITWVDKLRNRHTDADGLAGHGLRSFSR